VTPTATQRALTTANELAPTGPKPVWIINGIAPPCSSKRPPTPIW
jgi:hypothetical protein